MGAAGLVPDPASSEKSLMSNNSESATPDFIPAASVSGLQSLPTRQIRVLGVPLDMGASRRGVDMGPSAIRVAGLEARLEALGHHVTDGGNVKVEIPETQAFGAAERPLSQADSRRLLAHRRCRH